MASISAATAIFAVFSIFSVLLMILGFAVASKVSEQFFIPARWLMILVGLSCLNEAINAIVWADNADFTPAGGAFCEVSIRIRMLACIGIPAAVFAAALKVFQYITLFRDGEPMAYERRILETTKADLWLCILPGPLYILIQSADALLSHRRFAILEGVGCVYIPTTSAGSVLCTIGVVALFAFVALVFGLVTLSRWAGQREALRRDISRPGRAFLVRTLMLPIVLMSLVLGSFVLTLLTESALNALFSSAPGPSFALAQSATGIAVLPRAIWASAPNSGPGIVTSVELARWVEAGGPGIALLAFLLLAFDARSRGYIAFALGRLSRGDVKGMGGFEVEREARLPQSLRPRRTAKASGGCGDALDHGCTAFCVGCAGVLAAGC